MERFSEIPVPYSQKREGPLGPHCRFSEPTFLRTFSKPFPPADCSMIVTSNRGPDEWLATLADPVRAQRAIDRFNEIGVLARNLASSDLTQHRVLLVIALWEELDTPENVVDAGYQAFDSAPGPAIQANIAQLGSSNPSDVKAAVAAVKAAVNNAVTAAIEDTLSAWPKFEIW